MSKIEVLVSLFAAVLVSRAVGQQRRIPDEQVKRDKVNASSDKPNRREELRNVVGEEE